MGGKMKLNNLFRITFYVLVFGWVYSALAQNYPPSPVIEDITIEDTRKISFLLIIH